jgi:hypothetical protein
LKKKNLILVTGLLRSGTTWTGRTIASAKGIKYLNEPFNIDRRRKKCPVKDFYPFIDNHSDVTYRDDVTRYLKTISRSPTFYLTDRVHILKRYNSLKMIDSLLWEKKNFFGRPLMKDPMAILSAEWIYNTFNADVVIVMRNPLAFIGSIKKAGWSQPISSLLSKKKMAVNHFNEFIPTIEKFANHPPDLIDQGILMWNVIYSMIRYYSDKYNSKWYFVKHEDLSKNPLTEFTKLFNYLDVSMTEKVKSFIAKSTDGSTIDYLSRNSIQNLKKWQTILTEEEINRVKSGTKTVSQLFYKESEWV